MADEQPAPEPMSWNKATHPLALRLWSLNVMQDARASRGALRTAWGLTFYFHSSENRAFPSRQKLARDVGLSEHTVRSSLIELRRLGHIIERTETAKNARLKVWRPVFNKTVDKQEPRGRRGGRKVIEAQSDDHDDLIERQSENGLTLNQKTRLNVNHSIYEDRSKKDHSCVQGAITGDGDDPETEPWNDEDQWEESELPF